MRKRIITVLATAVLSLAPAGAALAGGHGGNGNGGNGNGGCDGLFTAWENAADQGKANGLSGALAENECRPPQPVPVPGE